MMNSRRLALTPFVAAILLILAASPSAYASPLQIGWEEFGESASGGGISSDAPGHSNDPSAAVDEDGNIVVAWAQQTAEEYRIGIYLKRWNGASWESLGSSGSGYGIFGTPGAEPVIVQDRFPQLKLESDGDPVVAWNRGRLEVPAPGGDIYCARWNGTAWVQLDGSASDAGVSDNDLGTFCYGRPALALDKDDNPILAWAAGPPGENRQIYVRRWNGTEWVWYGDSTTGIISDTGDNSNPAITLDLEDAPVVVWENFATVLLSEIYLKRWSGSGWIELSGSATGGGLSAGGSFSFWPAIARDPAGNPVVGWNTLTPPVIFRFLKKWSGTEWIEFDGSGSGSGMGTPSPSSMLSSLAVTSSGNPIVARNAPVGSDILAREIFLTAWDGDSWSGLYGSAAGASGTPGDSTYPSVAVGSSGGLVVAWSDAVSDPSLPVDEEIYVRRWTGFAAEGLKQFRADGATVVPVGSAVPEDGVVLAATVLSIVASETLKVQFEACPTGTAFTGTPTGESDPGAPGSEASHLFSGLPAGSYHWRARSMSSSGIPSAWIAFGSNPESHPDFTVLTASAPGSSDSGGDSDDAGGICSGSSSASASPLGMVAALLAIASALSRCTHRRAS